ncbi:MAG TPA: aminopeptidase P N-terminal domain-containing protein [Gaiellaceae bacterium]|nr:aminopeptidase P N-terminal domain-containing protein [Gaiellaceae bacterium]
MSFGLGAPPTADELRRRRQRLLEQLPPDALVLLRGAVPGVASRRFRQSNEFYYLVGIEVPGAYLLLDARTGRSSVYLPHRNERRERSEGQILACEDAGHVLELTGVLSVAGPEQLPLDLASILFGSSRPTFVPHAPVEGAATSRDSALASAAWQAVDPLCAIGSDEAALIDGLARHFPRCEVRDLSPILDTLRLHKSPYELEQMRIAARICGEATLEAMRSTAVGVYEYELEAVANFVFRQNGAVGAGYEAIVAGGRNAWHGHYNANDAPLCDGDLVLMDYAPDYRYYTSDIGRMWPVNGRYTDEQRQLYGFVLAYHGELLARIRPGATATGILEDAAAAMRDALGQMEFSKDIHRAACERAIDFPGHLSHPVGMSVHDVGTYAQLTFEPGLVFSVDPMIWVPEEKLYVRVEDTVAVSAEGVENLTGFVPLELDDVEAAMQEPGLLQLWDARA